MLVKLWKYTAWCEITTYRGQQFLDWDFRPHENSYQMRAGPLSVHVEKRGAFDEQVKNYVPGPE